ncbi:MAE_28990/MAE_18760 family HEPN-like nuclease [Natrinema sp. DC36]|uniref:MAE_28990/MAE_18760 family HEPN-like nuclease n=1 Tax=Natrinema sp. DC36 TaxID=2878680 RepID=UPI001CEFDBC0|nr:MAE_28990/MAE_18760 family HEPN-like nuclease [Natrinema sp. DC36]
MNPRTFHDADDDFYYYFQPPWIPYENSNIVQRIFQLHSEFKNIFESMNGIDEIVKKYRREDISSGSVVMDGKTLIFKLIRGLEVFIYNFPDIIHNEWFGDFWQTVAAATWRAEEGWFKGEPDRLISRLEDILDYEPNSLYAGVFQKLSNYIEFMGSNINPNEVPEKYRNDVYEARDMFCIGYYSTGLFVLGRAVEKALLELGQERKIETIEPFGREKDWDEAKFYSRKEALKKIQKPNSGKKMISKRQYHEISILVDYRNNVAHTEYENLTLEEAIRQVNNALSLLKDICGLIEEMKEIDDIDTVRGQKVN